jgi:hypothetical protein
MAGPTTNQQTNPGNSPASRLVLIHQGIIFHFVCIVESVYNWRLAQSPVQISKFKNLFSDNSMTEAVMELFVYPAPAFAKASKQDQVPAPIRSGS